MHYTSLRGVPIGLKHASLDDERLQQRIKQLNKGIARLEQKGAVHGLFMEAGNGGEQQQHPRHPMTRERLVGILEEALRMLDQDDDDDDFEDNHPENDENNNHDPPHHHRQQRPR